jgi:putative transposase
MRWQRVAVAVFIASQREVHGVPLYAVSCRALGTSQSWFYKWNSRELPARAARRERLNAEIARLYGEREGNEGSPRVTAALREADWRVSENTVAALMCQMGPGRPAEEETLGQHAAGPGPVAGTGPGQTEVRRRRDLRAVVRRRHRSQDRRGQAVPIGPGHGLPPHPGVRARRPARHGAGIRGAGHGRGGPRRFYARMVFHTDQGGVRRGGVPAGMRTAGRHPVDGSAGLALDKRGDRVLVLDAGVELRCLLQFTTRAQARSAVAARIQDYSTVRRHSALGMQWRRAIPLGRSYGQFGGLFWV